MDQVKLFFSSEQINIYGEKPKCMYQYEAFMAILKSQARPKAQQGKLKSSSKWRWNETKPNKECSTILLVSALAGELLPSIWWMYLDYRKSNTVQENVAATWRECQAEQRVQPNSLTFKQTCCKKKHTWCKYILIFWKCVTAQITRQDRDVYSLIFISWGMQELILIHVDFGYPI